MPDGFRADAPVALTLAPATIDALVGDLTRIGREGLRAVVRGAGTKSDWGPARPRGDVDAVVTTTGLREIVYHHAGDLTASVEAGAPLGAVNAALARHAQWIPLDPPGPPTATVGGIVATNDSGPRRQRYGAPRDLVIGMSMVLADGTLARSGGNVVKNVAGYDLARLFTGSFGSLGAIATVNLKLSPLPERSTTVVAEFGSSGELGAAAAALAGSQLTASALDFAWPPARLLVRLEATVRALPTLVDGTAALLRPLAHTVATCTDDAEHDCWRAHEAQVWAHDGTVLKVGILLSDLGPVLGDVTSLARAAGVECAAIGRAGLGVHYVRLSGDAAARAGVVRQVRAAIRRHRGTAMVLRAGGVVAADEDSGTTDGTAALMRAVKQQFDPAGLLRSGWPESFA